MSEKQHSSGARPLTPSGFWDVLAPHHSAIENSYFDVPSIRRIMKDLQEPVLVVGAGQGLIVAEVRKSGFQCDGVDRSTEMIRYAKLRRGITLIKADAKAIPMPDRTYGTVIYATGVVDFTADEEDIKAMLTEGGRIVKDSGKIFIALCKGSAAQESFLAKVGLLDNHVVAFRQSLELYLLNPAQMITWVAKRAGLSYFRAATLLLRVSALSTLQEKRMTFKMQRVFRRMRDPNSLISAAPEKQPYRNEAEIRNLFKRLAIPIKQLEAFASCYMVRIQ
jgi:ubiquinone/menaquinone biosynthesis C-methylase UbiE